MKRDILRLHLEKLRIAERLLAEGASVNPKATLPKSLPHTDPYLARRVPANATPFDLLSYAPPKDADLSDLFAAKGGVTGLGAADYFENGVKLFQSRDFQSAQLEFGKVIVAQPTNAEAYYYRARCVSIQRLYVEVERDLNRAIELKPQYPEAYLARAIARIELDKFEAAKADADKALSQGCDPGEGHYWRGKIKMRLDDRDGACEDFKASSAAKYADGTQAIKLYCR
jgi:tetratricopeptide (TPR) repeat protein